jgi:hypothetical protein
MVFLGGFPCVYSVLEKVEPPEVHGPRISPDLDVPLAPPFVPENANDTAHIRGWHLLVSPVDAVIGVSKVIYSIVCFVSVEVVNLFWEASMHVEKGKPMSEETLFFDPDTEVSMESNPADRFLSGTGARTCRCQAGEFSGVGIVMQQFPKTFRCGIVGFGHRDLRYRY